MTTMSITKYQCNIPESLHLSKSYAEFKMKLQVSGVDFIRSRDLVTLCYNALGWGFRGSSLSVNEQLNFLNILCECIENDDFLKHSCSSKMFLNYIRDMMVHMKHNEDIRKFYMFGKLLGIIIQNNPQLLNQLDNRK